MRWRPGGGSRDIEDLRGSRRIGIGGGKLGLGGLLLLVVLSVIFKQDFLSLVGAGDGGQTVAGPVESTPEEEKLKQFIGFVLDDVQATWDTVLPREAGSAYQHARLVLFRDAVQSACGLGESATGPFYCPGDGRVYIDLGFYQELAARFGAPGDFAQAYVLAHEIGHHVQNLLGTMGQVQQLQQRGGATQELSVRLELQADCYAGVWGHSANRRNLLETGDVEEGLGAAAAVGDDRIQRSTTGRVSPESFTHGSSEQRAGWFRRGLSSGSLSSCDTFSAR